MGIVLTGIVLVAGAGLLAVAVAMAVHGHIREDTLIDFRDHGGLVSAVAGSLFAITVGMLLVASWIAVGTAKDNAASEARALDDLAWFAHTTRQPFDGRLTALLQAYTRQVVDDDWPVMIAQRSLSQPAWNTLDAIRYEFSVYTPRSEAEMARYQLALGQLQSVYDDRLVRQDEARSSVPGILWLALVVSGGVVLAVPVVFGGSRRVVHGVLAFAATGMTTLVLFMIAEFTHPFSGATRVGPDAFVATGSHIEQIDSLWASAQVQQSRAASSPAPSATRGGLTLLATPTPRQRPRRKPRKIIHNGVPVPGLPAPVTRTPAAPSAAAAPSPQPNSTGAGPAPSASP